jgi:hypothetical protein
MLIFIQLIFLFYLQLFFQHFYDDGGDVFYFFYDGDDVFWIFYDVSQLQLRHQLIDQD